MPESKGYNGQARYTWVDHGSQVCAKAIIAGETCRLEIDADFPGLNVELPHPIGISTIDLDGSLLDQNH